MSWGFVVYIEGNHYITVIQSIFYGQMQR